MNPRSPLVISRTSFSIMVTLCNYGKLGWRLNTSMPTKTYDKFISDVILEAVGIKGKFYINGLKKPKKPGAIRQMGDYKTLKTADISASSWNDLAKKLAKEFDDAMKAHGTKNAVDADGYADISVWYKTESITVDGWSVEIQVQDRVRALVEQILKYPTAEYDEPWKIKKLDVDV